MTLEYKVDNTEGMDEAIAKLYKKEGDGFVLDVSGVSSAEETATIKQKLVEAQQDLKDERKKGADDRSEAERRRKANDRLKAELEAAKSGAEGGEELKRVQDEHATVLAAKEEEIKNLSSTLMTLHKGQADATFDSELLKAGFSDQIVSDIRSGAGGRYVIDDNGKVSILTADGKPMAGSGADNLATFTDLAAELAAAKPDFLVDKGKGGASTSPAGGKTTNTTKTITRADYEKLPLGERGSVLKDGVTVVDS